jgi:hypothetical protein
MKLTIKNLKQLINEVMNEVRLEPDYTNFASDDQIVKIRSLLDSGDPESIEMAKTLLDGLGASPSYVDDYMRNQEVGEVEKLASKHGVHGYNVAMGRANMDALGEYFTELDKFEKREVGRGRTQPDPAKEFFDRYQKVSDTYKDEDLVGPYEGGEDLEEAKKKKACKPSKGKRFAKRVNGKCRSYGQKGKAKGGGDRIRPGTKKGDAYCARSLKIKKCKNPPCANALSRKKWKCKGAKSQK